jgi:hypothetical protein
MKEDTMQTKPLSSDKHEVSANITAKQMDVVAPQASLEEVEQLANEMKRLLVRHEFALEHEGIRHQMETLERWMESYRRGLAAANKLSANGATWLGELRDQLKFAADEILRLEGEGGNPATREQAVQVEELIKAVRRIDKVLPDVEHMFNQHANCEKQSS